eukprot:TRINITY_DN33975_c0_g2_i1.p1 TRINITY_DN33975_c0_g2~~TRINITY_DN33975_c0_g2_i1.p1  ORF type:complete len:701 (-),score=120.56 TRINITY_DN33975_c0_g2_i1:219-2321(-)
MSDVHWVKCSTPTRSAVLLFLLGIVTLVGLFTHQQRALQQVREHATAEILRVRQETEGQLRQIQLATRASSLSDASHAGGVAAPAPASKNLAGQQLAGSIEARPVAPPAVMQEAGASSSEARAAVLPAGGSLRKAEVAATPAAASTAPEVAPPKASPLDTSGTYVGEAGAASVKEEHAARRLSYGGILAWNAAYTTRPGCVTVALAADTIIDVSSKACGSAVPCPPCFIITSTAASNTLRISQCSSAYVTAQYALGTAENTASVPKTTIGGQMYTFVNAGTSIEVELSDGTKTYKLAPMTHTTAFCYSSGSNRLYFPNTYFDSLYVGGGYGDTGVSISDAGVAEFNGAVTIDGSASVNSLIVNGGYGGTGATISNAGAAQFDGALTADGQAQVQSLTINQGFGSGGASISSTGTAQFDGALTTSNAATVGTSLSVGGGYSSSGATISSSGEGQFKGDLTTDGSLAVGAGYSSGGASVTSAGVAQFKGAMTVDSSMSIGGGYGSTGATISTDGVAQFNGQLTTDSTMTILGGSGSGGVSFTTGGNLFLDGGITAATGAASVFSLTVGGGYGSTGATISSAGVAQFDGEITTGSSLHVGGGYSSTGATISAAGTASLKTNVVADGQLQVGGGSGSSGVTISTSGEITADGAFTTSAAATVGSLVVGSGYGSGGASISGSGVPQFDGALTSDGTCTCATGGTN